MFKTNIVVHNIQLKVIKSNVKKNLVKIKIAMDFCKIL